MFTAKGPNVDIIARNWKVTTRTYALIITTPVALINESRLHARARLLLRFTLLARFPAYLSVLPLSDSLVSAFSLVPTTTLLSLFLSFSVFRFGLFV